MPEKSGRGVRRKPRVAVSEPSAARDVRARELVEQGVQDLQKDRIGSAQRKFRQALGLREACAPARAYLSLTCVLQHQWERAVKEARKALEAEPDHIVALTALARGHYGAGRFVEANSAAIRALQRFYGRDRGQSRSLHELRLVADMLVFMGAHRRLYQLYRRCVRGKAGSWDGDLYAYFGIAAFNSGQYRDARWAWREARLHGPDYAQLFTSYLFVNDMTEQGRVPPFTLDYVLGARASVDPGPEPPTYLKVFALRTLWHGDKGDAQRDALDLLVSTDEEWAVAFLLSVVREPDLSDEVKLHAGTLLMDMGLIPEDEPLEMHIDGVLQPVVIETEQMELDLDAETAAFFGEALQADAQGLGAAAEAGYRAVLEAVPTFVPALLGLATVCERSGRVDEAEKWLQAALEVEPLHPFARFHLATLYMQQERYAEAWKKLQAIGAAELPPAVRPAYHWIHGRLALLLDTAEAAEAAFQRGLRLEPDNDDLLAGLTAAREEQARQRQRSAQSSSGRRRRYEAKPITVDTTWVAALERLTLPRLQAIGRHVGVPGVWDLRKHDLAKQIVTVLRTELSTVWHTLSPTEQAALKWIAARGGSVPYAQLCGRFGDDAEDSFDWAESEPVTVPMRLQFYGLVFAGQLPETDESVIIMPKEARQALKFAWRRTPS